MATTPSNGGRSFSADVLTRVLTILHREGATKKTNLAGKTRLNYLTCVRYLDLLNSLGLVKTTIDPEDGGERYTISEFGSRFNSNLIAYLQKTGNVNPVQYQCFSDEKNLAEIDQNKLRATPDDGKSNGDLKKLPRKIMLVDDEEDILFTYQLFLSEGGYDVDVFSNPADALKQVALDQTAYQLVITDIRMSSINGLQLYHGIRAVNPNIRIIFLSALDAAEELVSILPGLSRQSVLKKPVNKEMLTKAVALALR